jgi:predicted RecB family endonuclease
MEKRIDRIEKALDRLIKGIIELRESQKKTDEQLNKTIKKLDDIGRQLADMGLVQGEVAEDLFYRNIRSLFRSRNMTFTEVKRNLKRKGVGEYDIVAINGNEILVIEVKNKLDKRMVDRFINTRLTRFKELFPEYKDRRLFGGIGALVVKDDVGRYAEKAGLYVLTQTDEGGAAIANRKGFRPKVFS